MSELLLDRAGRRRSPATLPGIHAGHAPGNKGLRYPADPPKVEAIIAVMRTAGDGTHGRRVRGLIVIMWRAGLRIQEALALTEGISITDAAHCWFDAARVGAGARLAWTPGAGNSSSPGSSCGESFRSVRCRASPTSPRAALINHERRCSSREAALGSGWISGGTARGQSTSAW